MVAPENKCWTSGFDWVVAIDARFVGSAGLTGELSSSLTIEDDFFRFATALVEFSSSLGAVVPSSSWMAFGIASSSILGMILVAKGSMGSGYGRAKCK